MMERKTGRGTGVVVPALRSCKRLVETTSSRSGRHSLVGDIIEWKKRAIIKIWVHRILAWVSILALRRYNEGVSRILQTAGAEYIMVIGPGGCCGTGESRVCANELSV